MKIGQNNIHLTDTGGDKPALLFVHGILMDHTVWDQQVDAFSDTHRVVCVDLRGFGASSSDSPSISMEDHCDDLIAVVDGLGLRDVTLVGWSMGGSIAQVMGARPDAPFDRYVLVDTTPQLIASDEFPHALPGEAAQQLGGLMAEDFAQGCAAFCSMIEPQDEAVTGRLTAIAAATNFDVAMTTFATAGGRSLLDALPQISKPTTVICGRNDAICLPQASEAIAAAVPGCDGSVVWIEDAGHAPFMVQANAFNVALRAAL
ncbi:MAG: alpha/beta hydrolase [Rhodobacteraceae bacterium]|nr:alpha/beta hydrolase [Paracoccaceae bacterium]